MYLGYRTIAYCCDPHVEIVPVLVVTKILIVRPVVTSKKQKMLDCLIKFISLRFLGALEEDAYEFLVSYLLKFHNLDLVKSHTVDCVVL